MRFTFYADQRLREFLAGHPPAYRGVPWHSVQWSLDYICFSLLKLFEIAIHWVSLMTTPPGMAGFPWRLAVALPGESKVRPHAYDGRRGSFVWQIEETWTDDYLPSGKLT